MRGATRLCLAVLTLVFAACGGPSRAPETDKGGRGPGADSARGRAVIRDYVERYLETYPSRATAEGRHDLDDRLESFSAESLAEWLELNRETAAELRSLLERPGLDPDDRMDAELVLRRAEREAFEIGTLRTPWRDPLFWSGTAANATVLLLVREDLPLETRLASAVARARQLPRLAAEAMDALGGSDPADISAELSSLAAGQVSSSARFYREGFPGAAGEGRPELAAELAEAGETAAAALEGLAAFLDELGERATGSPRLGDAYAESFRLGTGIEEPPGEVLKNALAALEEKKSETAAFGRSIWAEVFDGTPPPAGDLEVVRALFDRIAEDRAREPGEFEEDYRSLIDASIDFVRDEGVITLPEPMELVIGQSPSYFVGQSVGGVYPAGPWAAPEAPTLLFLPTPPPHLGDAQRDAFFRDFNHHFNTMITPHEFVPGHTLQLAWAARHPRKVRALFGDGVYIEGWGTFCERLMLDLGWGGPLDRVAHLKKQLENIARTIVDIRVHSEGMSRDEVLAFVRGEALQDEQFAANMWTRAITSTPQLTTYFLGYRQVHGLYEDVRAERGAAFDLRSFMDGMMELGPVPVARYRERMLGSGTSGS